MTDASIAGRLRPDAARTFVLGGVATFTLVSRKTSERFTYRVTRSEDDPGRPPVWFVSVLIGSNNESDYTYIGIVCGVELETTPLGRALNLARGVFRWTSKSRIGVDAPSVRAFSWFWKHVDHVPDSCEVWHSGACSRCGRALTDPESCAVGVGPICRSRAA